MIHRLHIPKYTDYWYDFRKSGYGASEIATVLAEYNDALLDELPGGSPIEVHLNKIGENVTGFTGNLKSKAGQSMEHVILNFYRYWDHMNPSSEEMYDNLAKRDKKNRVKSSSFIFTNDEYPWLYYSPDALELHQDNYGKWREEGLLEIKNTTSYQADKYTYGVSPTFITQVAQGLLISGMKYARILVFIDGYELRVLTLDAESELIKNIQREIILNSATSWTRVVKALSIKEQFGINYYYAYNVDDMTADQQKAVSQLQFLEPDLTGTKHEFDWVTDNIIQTPEFSTMEMTDDQWSNLVLRKRLKDRKDKYSKILSAQLNVLDSKLKLSLNGFHQAEYEGDKAFSYKPDKRGVKKLYVNPKLFDVKEMADGI